MIKSTVFVISIVMGLVIACIGIYSAVIGNWIPIIGVALGLGISGVIVAITIPLTLWSIRRWG